MERGGGKHLERSGKAEKNKMMTRSAYLQRRIFFHDSKKVPKGKCEKYEKKKSMKLPLEGSEELQ